MEHLIRMDDFGVPLFLETPIWFDGNKRLAKQLGFMKPYETWWLLPIGFMYGMFTYMYHKNRPSVGQYTIHGSYGVCVYDTSNLFWPDFWIINSHGVAALVLLCSWLLFGVAVYRQQVVVSMFCWTRFGKSCQLDFFRCMAKSINQNMFKVSFVSPLGLEILSFFPRSRQ